MVEFTAAARVLLIMQDLFAGRQPYAASSGGCCGI